MNNPSEANPGYPLSPEEQEPAVVKHGWAWAAVPAGVILSPNLTPFDVRVYALLLLRAGQDKYVWYGVEAIAQELKISEMTVKRAFANLIADNWIRRKKRLGMTSITHIFETQEECINFEPTSDHARPSVRPVEKSIGISPENPLNTVTLNTYNLNTFNSPTEQIEEVSPDIPQPTPELDDPIKEIERVAVKYPPLDLRRSSTLEAARRGRERDFDVKEEFEKTFHITPNWGAAYGRAFLAWLKERPEGQLLSQFSKWWYSTDWRGKNGQPPTVDQVMTLWPQAFEKKQNPMNRPTEVY